MRECRRIELCEMMVDGDQKLLRTNFILQPLTTYFVVMTTNKAIEYDSNQQIKDGRQLFNLCCRSQMDK